VLALVTRAYSTRLVVVHPLGSVRIWQRCPPSEPPTTRLCQREDHSVAQVMRWRAPTNVTGPPRAPMPLKRGNRAALHALVTTDIIAVVYPSNDPAV